MRNELTLVPERLNRWSIFGTQTYAGILDTKLLPKVTAYLIEVGATDPRNSVIGSDNILVLERF